MGSSTKVHHHQLTRGLWEHEPFLSLAGCKRLRPELAPKLNHPQDQSSISTSLSCFDLKSFIRRESGHEGLRLTDENKPSPPQVEATHPGGGTRWNPTPEQIGILEILYRSGMRTPNAQQIEQITAQLAKYGKIEGKNVFYWFQNHKARERQKLKRIITMNNTHCEQLGGAKVSNWVEMQNREESRGCKRKRTGGCGWMFQFLEEGASKTLCKEGITTLELFPLHPEGR